MQKSQRRIFYFIFSESKKERERERWAIHTHAQREGSAYIMWAVAPSVDARLSIPPSSTSPAQSFPPPSHSFPISSLTTPLVPHSCPRPHHFLSPLRTWPRYVFRQAKYIRHVLWGPFHSCYPFHPLSSILKSLQPHSIGHYPLCGPSACRNGWVFFYRSSLILSDQDIPLPKGAFGLVWSVPRSVSASPLFLDCLSIQFRQRSTNRRFRRDQEDHETFQYSCPQ